MNHRKKGRKFGRVRKTRKALVKTLLGSFFLAEKITTTEAKAKELRPLVEKLISKAKRAGEAEKKVATVRELRKSLPEAAVRKITGPVLAKVEKKSSGFVRVVKIGRRKSDGAAMAVLELV